MNYIKFLAVAFAMTIAMSASAKSSADALKGYNRVELSYAPLFVGDVYSSRSVVAYSSLSTMHGFSADYTRGIHVTKNLPMFIEVGGGIQFNTASAPGSDINVLRLNVPANFTYRFAVGSAKVWKISPYTGLNFGFNLVNDFDKFWMDNKVFQLGWNAGCNFTYKRFLLGVGYTLDLMPIASGIYDDTYSGTLKVKVGFEF